MLKLMREWGFPAVLGTLWGITLVYTLNAASMLPMTRPAPVHQSQKA